MRNNTKILALIMALLVALSCFVACGPQDEPNDTEPGTTPPEQSSTGDNNEPEKAEVLTIGNIRYELDKYTVVLPDGAEALAEASELLCEIAEQKTGVSLPVITDASTGTTKGEILLGDTARPESAVAKGQLSDKTSHIITQVGEKICIVGKTDADVLSGVKELLVMYFAYLPEAGGNPGAGEGAAEAEKVYHNVKEYGAKGDRETDDTEAFKAAIAAAFADGLPVYVPAGSYTVTDTLTLESVTLFGYRSASYTADYNDMPTLYHKNLQVPLFDVNTGSVSGLNIIAPDVTPETKNAAETIKVSGVGSRVNNLRIYTPYIGIKATYNNTGRSVFDNILIVQAFHTGVDVSGTWDVATLQNIEVWNPATSCPTAFRFGYNDALRATNLFAFNATTGFEFYKDSVNGGGCWGSFMNCGADFSSIAVKVGLGLHHLTFTGGCNWCHHRALEISSSTDKNTVVTMTGVEISTNGASPFEIGGGGMTTVSGCNITRTLKDFNVPPFSITGGKAITVVGNTIYTLESAANISLSFKGALTISGNTILSGASDEAKVFVNNSKVGVVNITGNTLLLSQSFD